MTHCSPSLLVRRLWPGQPGTKRPSESLGILWQRLSEDRSRGVTFRDLRGPWDSEALIASLAPNARKGRATEAAPRTPEREGGRPAQLRIDTS